MCNYLVKFSPRVDKLLAPVNAVLGHRSEWMWDPDQQEAFREVKKELCGPAVLPVFYQAKRHRVSADASALAIGAALLQ